MWHRLTSLLIVIAVSVTGLAAPAAAADNPPDHYYLALGDSLAYGYQPVRPLNRNEGYVALVHKARPQLKLENLSCPGETTATMLGGGICTYPGADSQLAAAERLLSANRGRVSLVTIDIGANDVNGCAVGGSIDVPCVLKAYGTVAANLGKIVFRLRAVAPLVRIVAMSYYNPNLAAYLNGQAGQQLATAARYVGNVLNAILATIYNVAGIAVADVAGAFASNDTTTMVPLPGAGRVPLSVARICQWTWMCSQAPLGPDIHANKQGYAVIAKAFEAKAG